MLAVASFLLLTFHVTERYWRDPAHRVSEGNAPDQTIFEWMLAHAAWSLTHLANPLLSDRLGAPEGANVIGNTSVLGLGVPLAPVTLLWGPTVAYAVLITFGFAATAAAWYFVLSRQAGLARPAAFVGAGFCAFSPGMVSQAGGHAHMSLQFLVPIIVWGVLRLPRSARPVRSGVALGLLITWQAFIGEEVLLITALACGVCVLAYALMRRRDLRAHARPFLTGLGVAGAVAVVLLAYPLYVQFFGPRSYGHLAWLPNFRADLAAYPAFSQLTLAGDPGVERDPLAQNVNELNAFFGWPLLLLVAVIVWWLRRDLTARIAAIVAVVFAAFSLGHEINLNGEPTGVPGPWWPVHRLPIFEHVVTTRFALVTAAAMGVLLALALDHALRSAGPRLLGMPRAAVVWAAAVAVALLPLTPRSLVAAPAEPVPAFFANGAYRAYTADDGVVLVVPWLREQHVAAMRWSAAELVEFRIANGRFLEPQADDPGQATLVRPLSYVRQLTVDAAVSGTVPTLSDADRARAREELRRQEVAVIVMPPDAPRATEVRATVDEAFGPGRLVEDMWVWDVRPAR